MKQYKYTVLDDDETFEETYSFESARNESDTENLVMEAAEDYYWEDKNLWESGYPISLEVFKEDGRSLGVFRVSYSLMPSFWVISENKSRLEKIYE